ncbi:3420_t:CDS:1, partial [Entrophospora sp. SA101]
GVAGGERLKSIFGYDQLISNMNTNTQTIGYVLLEDIDGKYKIKLNWKQKELRDNLALFLSGSFSISFICNSGEFINE